MVRVEPTSAASGGGASVSTFLELDDTPAAYTGQATRIARVNTLATALEFGNPAALSLQRVLIADPSGAGDHTTIQAAIDAAAAPSATNRWLILVVGRHLLTTALTLRSFVDVAAFAGEPVEISFALTANGDALTGVDDCVVSNIHFDRTDAFTGNLLLINNPINNSTWNQCRFEDGSTEHPIIVGTGFFQDCRFENADIQMSGAGTNPGPEFAGCHYRTTNAGRTINGSGNGHWAGGSITGELATPINITSPNMLFTGALIQGLGGGASAAIAGCEFISCKLVHIQTSGTRVATVQLTGGAKLYDCIITSSNNGSGTIPPGIVTINSMSSTEDTVISGCQIIPSGTPDTPIGLTSGIAGTSPGIPTAKLVLKNNYLDARFNVNNVIGIAAAGFSGPLLIELSGNTYRGGLVRFTNPGTGSLFFTGTDLETIPFPVLPGIGTGAATLVGNHLVQQLNLNGETAYLSSRMPAPGVTKAGGNNANVIQALLLFSAIWARGNDTFTDVDATNLNVHVPDVGTGWTAQANLFQILSNSAVSSNGGVYSWDDATANGRIEVTITQSASVISDIGGIFWRRADANNLWTLNIDNVQSGTDILTIVKRVGGVSTTVFTQTNPPTTGGRWQIVFQGSELRVYIFDVAANLWELQVVIDDADLVANTQAGIQNQSGTTTIDDWFFDRGDEVDLTVAVDHSQLLDALDHQQTLAFLNVPATNLVQGKLDIFDVIDDIRESELLGIEVTLDAIGASLTALNIHSVLIQKLKGATPLAENTAIPTSGWPLVI